VSVLTEADLRRLFAQLNEELSHSNTIGELYLVRGAVMCLALKARPSTRDVDGVFHPVTQVREAAERVAAVAQIDPHWLNDAVKGYLSARGDFAPFLILSHLRVIMTAQPAYLLAMKCLSMRIGLEFRDEEDVRFLLRLLDVRSYDEALTILAQYYPLERFPQKTLYALQELLPKAP
jgi:hypothetical protein